MCLVHRGGGGGEGFSTSGGYHEYIRGMFSTSGGYHEYIGGYHEYIGMYAHSTLY